MDALDQIQVTSLSGLSTTDSLPTALKAPPTTTKPQPPPSISPHSAPPIWPSLLTNSIFLIPWQNGPISLRVIGRCCHLSLGQGCLAYGSPFKTHCLNCKLCSQTKLWKLSHQALVPQGNHPFSPLISQGYFLCQQALWTSLLLCADTFISLLLATPSR